MLLITSAILRTVSPLIVASNSIRINLYSAPISTALMTCARVISMTFINKWEKAWLTNLWTIIRYAIYYRIIINATIFFNGFVSF